jgi:hypothetical protein
VDPRAIVAFVARASGMQVGELVTPREALAAYDASALPTSDVSLTSACFLP